MPKVTAENMVVVTLTVAEAEMLKDLLDENSNSCGDCKEKFFDKLGDEIGDNI